MKGIIILLTEEEFQAHLASAIHKALENFVPETKEIQYLTRNETSSRLRISLPTLNEYTKSGKLKAYRISGRVLYRKDDINSALTEVQPLKYRR